MEKEFPLTGLSIAEELVQKCGIEIVGVGPVTDYMNPSMPAKTRLHT